MKIVGHALSTAAAAAAGVTAQLQAEKLKGIVCIRLFSYSSAVRVCGSIFDTSGG